MAKQIAKVMTWVSVAACLIVAVSFFLFALNQTRQASAHQQEEVISATATTTATDAASGSSTSTSAKEGGVRGKIDDVANKLTSPFSGITAGSSSEWVVRGVGLLGALILYGFGLGYIARVIRVRV